MDFQGTNTGETASDFTITTIVYREDTNVSYHTREVGLLKAGGDLNYSDIISIEPSSRVFAVDLDLQWNGGRDYLRLWPPTPSPPWYERLPGPLRSTVGAMISIVVIWIGLPALVRRLRGRSDNPLDNAPTLSLHSPNWLGWVLRQPYSAQWTVGLTLAGIAATTAVAIVLWNAPWSNMGDADWRPKPTTLPLSAPRDRQTLETVANAFLDSSGLAAAEAAPEVVEVNHVKLISRNGERDRHLCRSPTVTRSAIGRTSESYPLRRATDLGRGTFLAGQSPTVGAGRGAIALLGDSGRLPRRPGKSRCSHGIFVLLPRPELRRPRQSPILSRLQPVTYSPDQVITNNVRTPRRSNALERTPLRQGETLHQLPLPHPRHRHPVRQPGTSRISNSCSNFATQAIPMMWDFAAIKPLFVLQRKTGWVRLNGSLR